jgi:hypothetical protein
LEPSPCRAIVAIIIISNGNKTGGTVLKRQAENLKNTISIFNSSSLSLSSFKFQEGRSPYRRGMGKYIVRIIRLEEATYHLFRGKTLCNYIGQNASSCWSESSTTTAGFQLELVGIVWKRDSRLTSSSLITLPANYLLQ